MEAVPARAVGGVKGVLFRSDLLARRRVLMDQWPVFVAATEGQVVRLDG